MNKTAAFLAPAKINLALHITGKRPDGFHTLKTVMQSISLCDIVTIRETDKVGCIEISCTDENIPCNEKNIAFKAAEAFFMETNIPNTGIEIHIEKHIPSQAGLGGGSADGAAVFSALNLLFGKPLSENELCILSAKSGADIPFCIKGGTALCEGIGEMITPVSPLPQCHIVIGKGKMGVSTKEAYEAIDKLKNASNYDFSIDAFDGNITEIAKICSNIFELVSDNEEIRQIKEIMMSHNAYCSVMSGSGSAIFGIFTDTDLAEKCCLELDRQGFFASLCQPVKHGVKIIE